MAIKMKTVVTFRTSAECVSHSRTDITTRDLTSIVDEPEERGGTNLGATPTETAINALIACTNVIGHKCAAKLGVDLGQMTIEAEWQLDRRGVLLQEEIDVPFPATTLTVNCVTDASQEELTRVGVETSKYCAIAKLFSAAGTDLNVNWVKST